MAIIAAFYPRRLLLCMALFGMALCWVSMASWANTQIFVKGLFAGRAVLEINGQVHMLKEGKSTPEGITLLRATSKFAQIEYNGEIKKLYLNRQVGGTYTATGPAEATIPRAANGHFVTSGRINNRFVEFMVDTGATNVTLNSFIAEQLGINFRQAPKVQVETASGNTDAYQVTLSSVAVGDVLLTNVNAFVLEGRFPQTILLGNSYLGRLNMTMDNASMVLKAKF